MLNAEKLCSPQLKLSTKVKFVTEKIICHLIYIKKEQMYHSWSDYQKWMKFIAKSIFIESVFDLIRFFKFLKIFLSCTKRLICEEISDKDLHLSEMEKLKI